MADKVKPIPDGYSSLTPYLYIQGAAEALEFYKKVFDATELMRLQQPDGRIGHAEMQIGTSRVMMADEFPEMGILGPRSRGGSTISLTLYVEDVDAVVSRAVEAGAKLVRPVQNQFYGDRSGSIEDPFGHSWHIATHVEDVPEDELQRRAAQHKA